jgi:hypothetical protein
MEELKSYLAREYPLERRREVLGLCISCDPLLHLFIFAKKPVVFTAENGGVGICTAFLGGR